ncbi:MAG: NADH-ubiquinone oxidoreductase-F iron-sulfur binding region domain-containing protein [Actinomycetota bacterium]
MDDDASEQTRVSGLVITTLPEGRTLLPREPVASVDEYLKRGGAITLAKAESLPRNEVIEVVEAAGLRGRGGAGFPTAAKWRGLLKDQQGVRFVCCNGAEGEPATFKDRIYMRANPYLILEGLAIAAYASGAKGAFIVTKSTFTPEIEALRRALREMDGLGILGSVPIEIVEGPDHYLLGEEKGLLEVIEGNDPLPRHLPPYVEGLFATPEDPNPAAVNNVETLCNVPGIVEWGPVWFRSVGTRTSPGSMLFTVVGDVQRPGMFELPLGTPLSHLIFDAAGGALPGREIKVVLPGTSNGVVTPDRFDVSLDYESMSSIGSGLGAGGFAVYDDSACAVEIARVYARFLHVESCGQCPPCKLHSGDVSDELTQMVADRSEDVDLRELVMRCSMATEGQRCGLPDGLRTLVPSLVDAFPSDFEHHIARGSCPSERDIVLPKIVDYDESAGFRFDPSQHRKRPNWTYEGERRQLP